MTFAELKAFDEEYVSRYGRPVCGTDEAGRGPLAGPVCCAAVILKENAVIEGLDDSKKLTPRKREQLFDTIIDSCIAYDVEFVDNTTIDEINILAASMFGMKLAAEKLSPRPAVLLVDGNKTPADLPFDAVSIVKGDGRSASIAAASVLAKVSRDRLMEQFDREYPEYGFARHKGYPTKAHYEAIARFGLTEYHRKTFLKKLV